MHRSSRVKLHGSGPLSRFTMSIALSSAPTDVPSSDPSSALLPALRYGSGTALAPLAWPATRSWAGMQNPPA